MNHKVVKKAVIPAAGLGTRFLPATKAMPKEMLPIVDKPTIQFIVEEAVEAGIEEILIITSSSKNSIIDHFDYSYELEERLKAKNKIKEYKEIRAIADMVNIQYIRQKEPMGLGHAILTAKNFIGNEPFAVLLGDDIVLQSKGSNTTAIGECIDLYLKNKVSVVGVQYVSDEDVSKYGIVDPDGEFDSETKSVKLKGMVEKPLKEYSPSNYAILGRYVLTPRIFQELEKTDIDIRGEIEITNAIMSLSKKEPVYAKEFSGKRYDIGSKVGYVEATIDVALSHKEIKNQLIKYMVDIIKNNFKK
ncbi:MAG: UTP--glucose-1-phosphate uridylyltransferase GalU [Malacoplasma sp.]|nr:UTP--glucose-1-phosphate uridylyltransferase GalU [Malacoplasma sp.]